MKGTMNSPYDRVGLGWGGGVVNRFPRDSSQGIPLHDGAIIMKIHFKSKGNINISVLVPAVIIIIIATIMVAIKEDNNN